MMKSHYHIPMQMIMKVEAKLRDHKEMEQLAKTFIPSEEDSMSAILKQLGDQIVSYLELTDRTQQTLREYLVEKNIPIEVNFKPLRVEQLVNIIEEWLSFHTQTSTIVQKLYTNKHRNILFKRVLFDEKETISDYFCTLSDRNMLKAVDLYQLLVEILSNYYLYEYNTDSETFFEKVNSFNTFVDVVEKFVHSEKRIYLGHTQADVDYVRRIEFDRLMQFWEEENSELVLLSEKRINKGEAQSQTTLINVIDCGVQAERECQNLLDFINSSLLTLNRITLKTNGCKQLELIQQFYSYLRKSKIKLMNPSAKSEIPDFTKASAPIDWLKIETESQFNAEQLFTPTSQGNRTVIKSEQPQRFLNLVQTSELELEIARTVSPPKKVKDVLDKIYKLYKEEIGLSVQGLEKCFLDIGIIEKRGDALISELLTRNQIKNKRSISFEEFKSITNYLMQKDKDLTYEVLEEFLRSRQKQHLVVSPSGYDGLGQQYYRRDRNSSFQNQSSRNYIGRYLNCTIPY